MSAAFDLIWFLFDFDFIWFWFLLAFWFSDEGGVCDAGVSLCRPRRWTRSWGALLGPGIWFFCSLDLVFFPSLYYSIIYFTMTAIACWTWYFGQIFDKLTRFLKANCSYFQFCIYQNKFRVLTSGAGANVTINWPSLCKWKKRQESWFHRSIMVNSDKQINR